MNHKVGDRVRIDCPQSKTHGCEATIWDIDENIEIFCSYDNNVSTCGVTGYSVVIDGLGKRHGGSRREYCYESHELIPLNKPHEKEKERANELDPALKKFLRVLEEDKPKEKTGVTL